MTEPGKVCNKCGERKPLTEFHKDMSRVDGHRDWCKACVKEYDRVYRKANRERINVQQQRYHEAHREKITIRQGIYYRANKEGIAVRQKAYRETHKKEAAVQNKVWYRANKEGIAARQKVYRETHKKEIAARSKAWEEANLDKRREITARRRALKAGAEGSHTRAEFRAICELFGWVCLCCETSHEESPLTVDHVVPLSKGGSNDILNIQPLCGYCNDSKGAKTVDYRGAST